MMAIRREGVAYRAYFQNRVSEIRTNLEVLKGKVRNVEDTAKIKGVLNPADLGTRPGVAAKNVGPCSEWHLGPSFLRLP